MTDMKAERKRTSIAITLWSILPLAFALLGMQRGAAHSAASCALVALASLGAAALTRTDLACAHLISVALLLLLWLPFATRTVQRMVFGFGEGVLRVAGSPGGFLAGAFAESLFTVPLAAFALGVWRRRSVR